SVRTHAWFLGSNVQLPFDDPNRSAIANALIGGSVDDSIRRGYRSLPRATAEKIFADQRARRIGGSIDASWRPSSGLGFGAVAGREASRARDWDDSRSFLIRSDGTLQPSPIVHSSTADSRTQRTTAVTSATGTVGSNAYRGITKLSFGYSKSVRRS